MLLPEPSYIWITWIMVSCKSNLYDITNSHTYLDHIDLNAIDQLRIWLDDQHDVFMHLKHEWMEFYYYNDALWEMIGRFFRKLFARRYVVALLPLFQKLY